MTDTPISKKYRILNQNNEWDRISFWTKGSDVHYDNDIATAQDLALVNNMLRNKDYYIGDMVYEKTAKPYYIFECVVNGTTAATTPSGYSSVSAGEIVEDGDAKFIAYDIRPTTSDSSSEYITASSKTVDDVKNHVVDTDNEHFYFGNYGGNYGFFTSADRSASSFHLFANDYVCVDASVQIVPTYSVEINPGETKDVYLYCPDSSRYEWDSVWIVSTALYNNYHFIYYNFESLGGENKSGWITLENDKIELVSVIKEGGSSWATIKNNSTSKVIICPGCICGYRKYK